MLEKCNGCKHRHYMACSMLADLSVLRINKCIFDYDGIKNIQDESLEHFVFNHNPITFLQYCNKGKELNVGDSVVTLRGGFGSVFSGVLLTITGFDGYSYIATDGKYDYGIDRNEWYMSVFKLDD